MEIPKSDNWTFKTEEVANNFDSHVREQLPWYELVTEATRHLILGFMPEGGTLLDIGCSTGNLTNGFTALEGRGVSVIGIDSSGRMCELYEGMGDVRLLDAERAEFKNFEPYNVAVCFLSLMFVNPAKRHSVIMDIMSHVETGGAVIIVDKQPQSGGYLGTVLNRMALKFKLLQGASAEDILNKDLSLNGIQVPVDITKYVSFVKWFQMGEFVGYIFHNQT